MVALDLGGWRERAALRSGPRMPRRRRFWRAAVASIFTPEVTAAWLLVVFTALVFALLLGLKDDPVAHASAVDHALIRAEQAHDAAPTCRLEDEWLAPCW